MKTLWCKNQENPSDRISHAWAPLRLSVHQFYKKKCEYFARIQLIQQSALIQIRTAQK
jgi:hypothetical protein